MEGDILLGKRWAYVLAFGIPFVAYVVMLAAAGVYPFGDQCVLHVDMYHQYCPFFTEFLDKLQSGDSLLYSFNVGLGSDFVALYAYYLASPLNWLLIIWPSAYVIEFMTLVIVLKVAGCGLTMFYYLKGHFGIAEEQGRYRLTAVLPMLVFSTAYAFSGYIAAYYWDVMWLDCVMLFPLIALGLERLVKEKKPALYFVTLAISILSNYYISIIICIFLFFYFLVLYLEVKEANLKTFGRFIFYSAMAGGTGAVLLLPEIKILAYSGSSYSGMPDAIEWYFDLISEMTRSFTMAETYTSTSHWPNLYAGSFTLLLVVLYLLNRKIPLFKRVVRVAALAFFWVSFSNNYLDFIWHGLHFPSSLPARQSFLYIFLVLVLAYHAVLELADTKIWQIAVGAVIWFAVIALGYRFGEAEGVSDQSLMLTALLVTSYALLIIMMKLTEKETRQKVGVLFCLVAMVEIIANMAATGIYTISRTSYVSKVDDYDHLLEIAEEQSDGEFYRLEDTERKTKSDSSLYGYSSATTFSSLMNLDVSQLYQSVRMEGGKNFYSYNGATPLWTALLSVKYVITDWVTADNDLMTLVAQSGSYYLYESNYYLSLGFMLPSGISNLWDNSSSDKISNLNGLASLLGASTELLALDSNITQVSSSGSTTITVDEDGYYYANYTSTSASTMTVTNPNGGSTSYSKASHKYLLDLGYLYAGQTVTVSNSKSESIEYTVYQLDLDALDEAYATISAQTMELDTYTSTEITGTIEVTEAGDLFFSIPAEEGWTLYVDGVKTEWTTFKDAFITVSLTEGTHTIRLVYHTPHLMLGLLCSLACIALFAASMVWRRKHPQMEEIVSEEGASEEGTLEESTSEEAVSEEGTSIEKASVSENNAAGNVEDDENIMDLDEEIEDVAMNPDTGRQPNINKMIR